MRLAARARIITWIGNSVLNVIHVARPLCLTNEASREMKLLVINACVFAAFGYWEEV